MAIGVAGVDGVARVDGVAGVARVDGVARVAKIKIGFYKLICILRFLFITILNEAIYLSIFFSKY